MKGRCEICGKENTSLLCLYDLHICEECAEDYRNRTERKVDRMEREEAIRQLEDHINGHCPADFKRICKSELMCSILALLKEQQPKIMRLPVALGSYDPIFAEFRNIVGDGKTYTKWVDAVISMDARHVTITDLYCEETESRKLDFDFNLYNRAFRFWSTKPTDEQRKAVPWETH